MSQRSAFRRIGPGRNALETRDLGGLHQFHVEFAFIKRIRYDCFGNCFLLGVRSNMDFVSAWKASSIVLTGAFGILGLLKEFKDKGTNRVTPWGYISLIGIVVSTILGVAAQIKESHDTAQKTLEVAQKSDRTLQDIERLLSPLDKPVVDLIFDVPCDKPPYTRFCTLFHGDEFLERDSPVWKEWPANRNGGVTFRFDVFTSQIGVTGFLKGMVIQGDLYFSATLTSTIMNGTRVGSNLELAAFDVETKNLKGFGAIKSVNDIPGRVLIISVNGDEGNVLNIRSVTIKEKNERPINVDANKIVTLTTKNGDRVFRYDFPAKKGPF